MNTFICNEKQTIGKMITIYCKAHHSTSEGICESCNNLLEYAGKRLDNCPFGEKKTTCGNCQIHCYNKDMQQQVKKIMKYSGPRMIFHHPLLALRHIVTGLRKNTSKPALKRDRK